MNKGKRRRIDWIGILAFVQTEEMRIYFNELSHRFVEQKKKTHLSMNRCAYYTLKHFYSTTTIDELIKKIEDSIQPLEDLFSLCAIHL